MKWISLLALMPTLALALPVRPGENFRVPIAGEYIVKGSTKGLMATKVKKLGKDLFLVRAKHKLDHLDHVSPNYAYYGNYLDVVPNTPNDAKLKDQFHHIMIKSHDAWQISMGDEELIVAVTDNEFEMDHDDLVKTWWVNPNEIPGNNIDDDNNGYVDDVNGWDFMGEDNNMDSDSEPTHGTHVAGTIAAQANNKIGGAGIAPKVKVMALRWYGNERAWTSAIVAETYRYAVDNGAKIISTSYNIDGLVDDEAYLDAVAYAKANDVLIFNSAGNSGRKNPPRQKIKDVVLVCSVQSKDNSQVDKKSGFSNYGTGIDICAPGDPVYAPVQKRNSDGSSRYGELRGTSMAAPVAASVAALIWSRNPNFAPAEVLQRLYDSADNIDKKNRRYKGLLGSGRVNAFQAIK
jgi:subtilisin family serine protease